MKKNKRRAVYAQNHQEKYGVEKRGKNPSGEEYFAGIAPLDVLRRSQEAQMQLYQTGDIALMREFFIEGGCFGQKVQRQMTLDDNLDVLDLFLVYWEFIPTERSYMIKNASLPFVEHYLQRRRLGKQGEEFTRCGRFKKEFVARYAGCLNDKAKEICRGFRKIDVK